MMKNYSEINNSRQKNETNNTNNQKSFFSSKKTNSNNNNKIEEEEINDKYPLDNNYFNDFKTEGEIYSLSLYSDNKTLIIGDGEDSTYFYDIIKKKIIFKKKINSESVSFLSFSQDNKYLLSASLDGEITLFLPEENFKILSKIHDQANEINWVEWNPKGPMFAFGCSDGKIFVYLINSLNLPLIFDNTPQNNNSISSSENSTLPPLLSSSTCGKFNHEGTGLICCYDNGSCKLFDLKNGVLIKNIESNIAPILCMAIADQNYSKNLFVVGTSCNEIQFYSYEKKIIIFYQEYDDEKNNNNIINSDEEDNEEYEDDEVDVNIEFITFCYDNNYCAFCDSNSNLKIFDMKMLQIRNKFSFEDENITKIVPSTIKREIIYTSSTNGNIYIIDIRFKGKIINQFKQHNDTIYDFLVRKEEKTENGDFNNNRNKGNNEIIISSSLDKTINLFIQNFS